VCVDVKLLTLNELSELTGLPAAWLRREADAGRLPCIRAGRLRMFDLNLRTRGELPSVKPLSRRLFDVADLRQFIEARKGVTPNHAPPSPKPEGVTP